MSLPVSSDAEHKTTAVRVEIAQYCRKNEKKIIDKGPDPAINWSRTRTNVAMYAELC